MTLKESFAASTSNKPDGDLPRLAIWRAGHDDSPVYTAVIVLTEPIQWNGSEYVMCAPRDPKTWELPSAVRARRVAYES
jgi:hypothetical protein